MENVLMAVWSFSFKARKKTFFFFRYIIQDSRTVRRSHAEAGSSQLCAENKQKRLSSIVPENLLLLFFH